MYFVVGQTLMIVFLTQFNGNHNPASHKFLCMSRKTIHVYSAMMWCCSQAPLNELDLSVTSDILFSFDSKGFESYSCLLCHDFLVFNLVKQCNNYTIYECSFNACICNHCGRKELWIFGAFRVLTISNKIGNQDDLKIYCQYRSVPLYILIKTDSNINCTVEFWSYCSWKVMATRNSPTESSMRTAQNE